MRSTGQFVKFHGILEHGKVTGGNDESVSGSTEDSRSSDLPQLPSLHVTITGPYTRPTAYVWGIGTAKLAWTIVATGIAMGGRHHRNALFRAYSPIQIPVNWSQTNPHSIIIGAFQFECAIRPGKLEEGWRNEMLWYGEKPVGSESPARQPSRSATQEGPSLLIVGGLLNLHMSP
jgi:hypothetical protein